MRPIASYAWMIRAGLILASTLLSPIYPAHAEPNKQILDRAESYKEPSLRLLETLVNIDSGSGDENGLNKVAETIMSELRALGAQIETVKPAEPAKGPALSVWR